jgi:hypothetical protein
MAMDGLDRPLTASNRCFLGRYQADRPGIGAQGGVEALLSEQIRGLASLENGLLGVPRRR